MSGKTLAQIGYEAAATRERCPQPWAEANQGKWGAAADAVAERCAEKLDDLAQKATAVGRDGGDFTSAAWAIRALKGNANG